MVRPTTTENDPAAGALSEDGLDPAESAPPPSMSRSLRARIIGGSLWTFGGYGISQAIRLANNLVLTRLLYPEAFGLMTYVNLVLVGVALFSDIGVRASILQDSRGEDPRFLGTAWTIQVGRGMLLFLVVCALAWPAAWFYEQPALRWLIPVAGLNCLFDGFTSTAQHTLDRRVTPGREVMLTMITQIITSAIMITAAIWWRSVWVLVIGSGVGALLHAIWTHRLIPGYSDRFCWDREAARSILLFGRWIILSTGLTFLITQGDRLVLGKLMTPGELGVYAVAFFMADSVVQAIARLAHVVLHPVYSEIARTSPARLREQTYRLRGVILLVTIPVLWVLAVFGPLIMRILYDERYAEAGWMLQVLAVGAIGRTVSASADRQMLAVGDSFGYMCFYLSQAVLLGAGMAVGYTVGGVPGVLVGISAARILEYVPLAILLNRHNWWLPKLDGLVFAASAAVIAGGLAVFGPL